MPLGHFRIIDSHNIYADAAYCEVCHKGGSHYGYGEYWKFNSDGNRMGELHDFCSKHGEEYLKRFLNKVRKEKLKKLSSICH